MLATIIQIARVDIIGKKSISFCENSEKNLFMMIPRIIGISITFTILQNIPIISTFTVVWSNKYVISGVNMGESRVFVLVIQTERAISPFAKYVMTLLAVPPGHVPTKITPAISAESR